MKFSIQKFDKFPVKSSYNFLLPLILVLQLSLPGMALCFGSDGHTDLESYSDGLCNEIISNSASRNPSTFSFQTLNNLKTQHCGPCVDIRMSDDNSENKLISSNGLIPEINIHPFAAHVISDLWFQENSIRRFTVQELSTGDALLESLQTTILIC